MKRQKILGLGLALALGATAVAAPIRAADEIVDYAALQKIRDQGMTTSNSKVMDTAWWLTDWAGPRLAGSVGFEKAAAWTIDKMKAWGLVATALEPWPVDPTGGNNGFPRGWENEKFYMHAVAPQKFQISGMASAWTPGTEGLVRGDVVLVTDTTEADLKAKWSGKLKGKWVISAAPRDIRAMWSAPATRLTEEQLDRMETPVRGPEFGAPPAGDLIGPGRAGTPANPAPPAAAATPAAPAPPSAQTPAPGRGGRGGRGGAAAAAQPPATPPVPFSRNAFLKSEGVLGVISTTATGHGIITIGGASRTLDPATIPPLVVIPAEDYNRIARLIARDIPVTIEADIKNSFRPLPPMYNIVGEIRGSEKPDEVVMLGAHFDSWHASPGATDNIAGSAVMLEAMRILKASGVPLRRTVRIGLWNGEEQGLIGSRLYVAQHFGGVRGAGPAPLQGQQAVLTPITPDHAKFQAYFNVDNGTGAIRGVYLQQNAALAPIFRAWMEPLRNIGVTHLAPGNTGSTDHVSFDNAGLPGFQFVQDSIEYNVFTHHTNLDTYDQLQPEDMRRNATIVATFAYLAANRPDLLPRKPRPVTPLPSTPAAPAGG